MQSAIVGFILGIAWLQQQSTLPNKSVIALLGGVAVLLFCLSFVPFFTRHGRWVVIPIRAFAGLMFGIAWSSFLAVSTLSQNLPKELENRDLVVTGTVSGLPRVAEENIRFRFQVETAVCEGRAVTLPDSVLLSWKTKHGPSAVQPDVSPGQKWQLNVRLKRPHGSANPEGFDYELQLFEQNIRATGYVRDDRRLLSRNFLIDSFVPTPLNGVNALRYRLRERILRALPDGEYTGVIVALVIGEQHAISRQDWDIFNRTGISHLVAISGLHITLVSGLFAALVGYLWRRSFFMKKSLPVWLPSQKAAALAGLGMAFVYVSLAGFGIPARRTLCMIVVVVLALWFNRTTRFSRVLSTAAAVVLLFDPVAVLIPGFWLSFGAVGVIVFATAGRVEGVPRQESRFKRLGKTLRSAARTQWAVTLGLVPLTMLFFGRISLIGPIANAVAIPVVSLFTTPLALIGSVLPEPLISPVLTVVHFSIVALAVFLKWLSAFPFAVWSAPVPSFYLIVFAVTGTLWMLLPRGWPLRYLGILCWLPLFLSSPIHPEYGEAHVTVFDVGQGSAVLVETEKHRLLFDTGPWHSVESDAADRVVLPYLRARGIDRLDMVVVSHGDSDHSGGLLTLSRKIPVNDVISSMPPESLLVRVLPKHRPCLSGQHWEWENVRFDMLSPGSDDYLNTHNKTNNLSCVIKVSTSKFSVLLTGDVEEREESALIKRYGKRLKTDILIVPHHGSKTSSSWPFLFTVKPRTAVFQVGYLNPYRHPAANVIDRYHLMNIQTYRTDRDGAVVFKIGEDLTETTIRKTGKRYWHDL